MVEKRTTAYKRLTRKQIHTFRRKQAQKQEFITKSRKAVTLVTLTSTLGGGALQAAASTQPARTASTSEAQSTFKEELLTPLSGLEDNTLNETETSDTPDTETSPSEEEAEGVDIPDEEDKTSEKESSSPSQEPEASTQEATKQVAPAPKEAVNPQAAEAITIWGDVQGTWDETTGTLTLTGGVITDSTGNLESLDSSLRESDVKHLVFTGDVDAGESLASLMSNFSNLESLVGMKEHLNTSKVTDLSYAFSFLKFQDDEGFGIDVDLSGMDFSSVTDVNMAFGLSRFTSLNLSGCDFSSLTDTHALLSQTIVKDLNLSNCNFSAVTNVEAMLQSSNITHINMSGTDFSSVVELGAVAEGEFDHFEDKNESDDGQSVMFQGLDQNILETVDMSNAKFGKVESLARLFSHFENLTSVNMAGADFHSVISTRSMFASSPHLKDITLPDFGTALKRANYMFQGCVSLETVDLAPLSTGSIITMFGMFYGDIHLKTANFSHFDGSSVVELSEMFQSCRSLERVDFSHFNGQSVKRMNNMFSKTTNVNIPEDVPGYEEQYEDAFWDFASLQSVDFSNFGSSTKVEGKFLIEEIAGHSPNLEEFLLPDLNLDSGAMTPSMSGWYEQNLSFENCPQLKRVDFSNTHYITEDSANAIYDYDQLDLSHMFKGLKELEFVNLSHFIDAPLKNMNAMFEDCSALQVLNIDGFNTENLGNETEEIYNGETGDYETVVLAMTDAFKGAVKLRELTLGKDFNFVFVGSEMQRAAQLSPHLEPVPQNEAFTGVWQDVGGGSVEHPQGNNIGDSQWLMTHYEGTMAGTYVWQPTATSIPPTDPGTDPTEPGGPGVPSTPGKPSPPTVPSSPVIPDSPRDPNSSTASGGDRQNNLSQSARSAGRRSSLPSTGENYKVMFSLLGLLSLFSAGVLMLLRGKKKDKI